MRRTHIATDRSGPSGPAWLHGLSPQAQGVIVINLTAVIFGCASLYGKLDVSPFWIVGMRAVFASITLGLLGGHRVTQPVPRSIWLMLALSSAIIATHWLLFFMSVQLAGVAVATLTFATFPLFTVLIEAALERRLPHPLEIAVAFVIVLAVALLVKPSGGGNNIPGAVVGIGSAITYALFWRAGQSVRAALPPMTVSFYQCMIVLVLVAPMLFFATPAPSSSVQWLFLAALGVVNTALMLQLYLYALKRLSASTCSGFVALEPVYGIALAALLFGEPITPWLVVSIILILGASFTLLKLEGKQLLPG